MQTPSLIFLFTSLLAAGPAFANPTADAAEAAASTDSESALVDLVLLDGTPMSSDQLQGQVVLFVNVASRCGYTGQYAALQELYESYSPKGLVVVGVPCNQFGGQEPGSPAEIATFCKKSFGVTFPLLSKQDVNGAQRSALYSELVGSTAGGGRDISWNFEKFLLDRSGKVVARFPSATDPSSEALISAIENVL